MRINAQLDREKLRQEFAYARRVQVQQFLDKQSADGLHAFLVASRDWRIHVNQEDNDKAFEVLPSVLRERGKAEEERFRNIVFAQASWKFQYFFEAIRISADGAKDTPLSRFLRLLCSDYALDLVRFITGTAEIDYADGQATAYGPGHFLTGHDDSNAGQRRSAAYVLNLTPVWRTAWGGILQFDGTDGNIERGFIPGYNVLNLFSVPQPHSVSFVTPFAAHRRYAITGWFRSREPEAV